MSVVTPTGEWVFDFDAGGAISDATDGGGSAPAIEFVEASEADDEPAGSGAEATSALTEASVTPLLPNSVAAYLADLMPAISASAAVFSIAPVLSDLDSSTGGGDVSVSLPPAADSVDAAPPSSAPEASAPSAASIAPDIKLIGIPAGPEFVDDSGMIVEDIDGDGVVVDDDPSGGGSYDGSGYSYDYSGSSLTSAGDINGDGIDDQIVSSYAYADGVYTSATYVVFGSADGSLAVSDISQIDGSNGFRIDGTDSGGYGPTLIAAGDINGDGFADLIASSYGFGDTNACYVVFGNADGQAAIDVATLDGSNGFRIDGLVSDEYNSWWATAAGDVNGDGFDDLIIDVFNSDSSGAYSQSSYVVLGSASGFAAAVDVATLEPADAYLPDPPPDGISDDPGDYVTPDGEILPGIGDEDIIYGRPVWSKDLIDGEIPGAIDILPIYIALGDVDLL